MRVSKRKKNMESGDHSQKADDGRGYVAIIQRKQLKNKNFRIEEIIMYVHTGEEIGYASLNKDLSRDGGGRTLVRETLGWS